MNRSKSIFLCEYCGWKRVCETESSGLHELKSDSMSGRKFRCLGCGRAIVPRPAPDPQRDLDRKSKEEKSKSEYESWMQRSMELQRNFLKDRDEQDND
jgi:hypothetical protein